MSEEGQELAGGPSQWFWAAARTANWQAAAERFVVAPGQERLWPRVRSDVDWEGQCAWMAFGPVSGEATLADCVYVLIQAREHYGVDSDRAMLELARVPSFARFLRDVPHLHMLVTNFRVRTPAALQQPHRDDEVVAERTLRQRIRATLGAPPEDFD